MNDLVFYVREIEVRSLALGTLASEAMTCSVDNRFMASLSCLFILTEQCVKLANESIDGNFKQQINELKEKEILSIEQVSILHQLREIRNILFHESHYSAVIENSEGKVTLLSEPESKEMMWNKLSLPIFEICVSLLKFDN